MKRGTAGKGNTALLTFHRSCAGEFNHLISEFNLLFYGYGCKQALLEDLFPDAIIFNLKLQNLSSVVEDLVLSGYSTKSKPSIKNIDQWLGRENRTLILVLLNFDFNLRELQSLNNIRLIGTIESIKPECTLENIQAFNFIFRDLTTFVDYSNEVLDVEVRADRVLSALRVMSNVPSKSATVFKNLVAIGPCSINDLFNQVKKDLMLTKASVIENLLNEFVDHGIVKVKDNANIILNLSKDERKRFLDSK